MPAEAVAKAQKRINGMQDDMERILQQEREERMLQKADMQATKAHNLMEHADEIARRPAKTWMVSEKNKKARRDEEYEQHLQESAAAGNTAALEELKQRQAKREQAAQKKEEVQLLLPL